jgi:fido (protein-threonine AMPylation protein)
VEVDQVAARLHHRLVQVHPFINGNGRHARLLTDRVLRVRGATPFTWGRANLAGAGPARDSYIAALRAADGGNFASLYAFVRS